eukprot:998650-Prorocentrum_minimum.AAC.5
MPGGIFLFFYYYCCGGYLRLGFFYLFLLLLWWLPSARAALRSRARRCGGRPPVRCGPIGPRHLSPSPRPCQRAPDPARRHQSRELRLTLGSRTPPEHLDLASRGSRFPPLATRFGLYGVRTLQTPP